MADHRAGAPTARRLTNWDLLRALSMFLVVVVHASAYVPRPAPGFDLPLAVSRAAIVCDPVFFMLSGYFALRPLRGNLAEYYLKKVSSVILPLVTYSVALYVVDVASVRPPGGYPSYFAGQLMGGWWFVPTLVPMLLVAPFAFRALEGLDDAWIVRLSAVAGVVLTWGAVCHLVDFCAARMGLPGVAHLLTIARSLLPAELPGGYLVAFVAGYLYRRLSAILSAEQKRRICVAGALAWVLATLFAGLGVPESDPNQLWLVAAFSTFFLFEGMRGLEGVARRAITWAAQRSYSIYLLQYTTIALIFGPASPLLPLGGLSALPLATALPAWAGLTVAAYALALLAASVVDPLVVKPAQRLFDRLVSAPLLRREERGVI